MTYNDARKKANSKWDKENKDRVRYLQDRSKARNFIIKKATMDDLKELELLIKERMLNENRNEKA